MFKKFHQLQHEFIRDKRGDVQILQFPNMPIIGWFICLIIAYMLPMGTAKNGFAALSTSFLAIWAYLEITSGRSYFRRSLGTIIATIIIFNFFR